MKRPYCQRSESTATVVPRNHELLTMKCREQNREKSEGKQKTEKAPSLAKHQAHFSFRRSIRCATDWSFSVFGGFVPNEYDDMGCITAVGVCCISADRFKRFSFLKFLRSTLILRRSLLSLQDAVSIYILWYRFENDAALIRFFHNNTVPVFWEEGKFSYPYMFRRR